MTDPATEWRTVTLNGWYGDATRTVEIATGVAHWDHAGTPPIRLRWVLVRDPTGEKPPQAFFSTDTTLEPEAILGLFVRRWQVEVTFAEVRVHLGVETQRQWSDRAILRTTPALLGIFSLITLWATTLVDTGTLPRAAAWYDKTNLTFSDAIAAVRYGLWLPKSFLTSTRNTKPTEIPPEIAIRMAEALCYAT